MHVRLAEAANGLALQTAATTLTLATKPDTQRHQQHRHFTLTLLPTVHLAEPAFYKALASEAEHADRALFEMIVDDRLLQESTDGARRLDRPVQASDAARRAASGYGLVAQSDHLDCSRPNYVLADCSRSSLGTMASSLPSGGPLSSRLAETLRRMAGGGGGPLWASVPRRLLACALPAPELLLLLDDWIASGGAAPSSAALPLARALATLDLPTARKLAFAQTLVGGERSQQGTLAGAMVRARNACAVDEVQRAVDAGCTRIVLLFGALHMRDMRAQLQSRFVLETASEPRWLTAFAIPAPEPTALPLLPLVAASFLALEGVDWLETVSAAIRGLAGIEPGGDALLDYALYQARHLLAYAAISTWALDLDVRWWIVQARAGLEAE